MQGVENIEFVFDPDKKSFCYIEPEEYDFEAETLVRGKDRQFSLKDVKQGNSVMTLCGQSFQFKKHRRMQLKVQRGSASKIDDLMIEIQKFQKKYVFAYAQQCGAGCHEVVFYSLHDSEAIPEGRFVLLGLPDGDHYVAYFHENRWQLFDPDDNAFEIKVTREIGPFTYGADLLPDLILTGVPLTIKKRMIEYAVEVMPEKVVLFDVECTGDKKPWLCGYVVAEQGRIVTAGEELLEDATAYLQTKNLKSTASSDDLRYLFLSYQDRGYILYAKGNSLEALFMLDRTEGKYRLAQGTKTGGAFFFDPPGQTWIRDRFVVCNVSMPKYEVLMEFYKDEWSIRDYESLRKELRVVGKGGSEHVPLVECFHFFRFWRDSFEDFIVRNYNDFSLSDSGQWWDKRLYKVDSTIEAIQALQGDLSARCQCVEAIDFLKGKRDEGRRLDDHVMYYIGEATSKLWRAQYRCARVRGLPYKRQPHSESMSWYDEVEQGNRYRLPPPPNKNLSLYMEDLRNKGRDQQPLRAREVLVQALDQSGGVSSGNSAESELRPLSTQVVKQQISREKNECQPIRDQELEMTRNPEKQQDPGKEKRESTVTPFSPNSWTGGQMSSRSQIPWANQSMVRLPIVPVMRMTPALGYSQSPVLTRPKKKKSVNSTLNPNSQCFVPRQQQGLVERVKEKDDRT